MLYNTVLFGKMVPARLAICPEKLIANGFGNAYKYKFMILIEARLGRHSSIAINPIILQLPTALAVLHNKTLHYGSTETVC